MDSKQCQVRGGHLTAIDPHAIEFLEMFCILVCFIWHCLLNLVLLLSPLALRPFRLPFYQRRDNRDRFCCRLHGFHRDSRMLDHKPHSDKRFDFMLDSLAHGFLNSASLTARAVAVDHY